MTTNNDALVIELQDVFDTGLAMRVVHQDETRIPRDAFKWTATNGFRINSYGWPSFSRDYIDVRGYAQEKDRDACVIHFDDKACRDAYRARLTEAVAELNRQLAPKKRMTGWCNVYEGPGGALAFGSVCPYADRASADANDLDRLGVIYIDAEVQP